MKRATLGLLALALAGPACGGAGDDAPPRSVLLITLDTTRADVLSGYGGIPGLTPNLDALAAEGVTYDTAWTVAPLTMPAHA